MPRGHFVATVTLHACPKAYLASVEDTALDLGLSLTWTPQNLLAEHFSAVLSCKMSEEQITELAASLYALGPVHFEINQRQNRTGLLLMGVPGLGVFRADLNQAGSIMLSEDQINQMISSSAGNQREFMRLLRMSLGQSWDDILEPFRGAKFSSNVVLFNKAG